MEASLSTTAAHGSSCPLEPEASQEGPQVAPCSGPTEDLQITLRKECSSTAEHLPTEPDPWSRQCSSPAEHLPAEPPWHSEPDPWSRQCSSPSERLPVEPDPWSRQCSSPAEQLPTESDPWRRQCSSPAEHLPAEPPWRRQCSGPSEHLCIEPDPWSRQCSSPEDYQPSSRALFRRQSTEPANYAPGKERTSARRQTWSSAATRQTWSSAGSKLPASPEASKQNPRRKFLRSVSVNLSEIIRTSPKKTAVRPRASIQYAMSKEMKGRIRSQNRYALQGEWLTFWDILLFACLIFTGITEPVILVFEISDPWCRFTSVVISAVYMMDTCINFVRAQKVPTREGVALVTDISVLAKNYLLGMFLIDLISALPISIIFGKNWRRLHMLRMIRFFRFIHMWRLMQNVQKLTSWSYSVLNMCEKFVILFFVLHWVACAWVSMQRGADVSWFLDLKERLRSHGADSDFNGIFDEYLLSLYWSVTVISSVGFGDITPLTNKEILCAQICMAIGGGVWAYIVGSVSSIVFNMDKHRHSFENLMNDVHVLCKERHLPKDLAFRVRDFFRHARDHIRMKEYHATVHELSPALKGEVIKCMYGSHFRRVWYFDIVDEYTALLLVENLIPQMYARDEWIEASVDKCRALVFLRSGVCVRKANVLAPGAVWGLDVILGSEEHDDIEELLDTANAKSVTFAVVLKLSKHGIDHAARLVPAFAKRLRKAHLRMLLWRGVIAASRAAHRIKKPSKEKTSRWDKLAQVVGKVVHLDRELLNPTNPLRKSRRSMTGCESMTHEGSYGAEETQENGEHSRPPTPRALDSLVRTSTSHALDSLEPVSSNRHAEQSNGSERLLDSGCKRPPSPVAISENDQGSRQDSRPATPRALDITQDESCRPKRGISMARMLPLPHLRKRQTSDKSNNDKSSEQSQLGDFPPISWKSQIERQIERSDEKISTMHADLSEEIATISDEVTELTRLMHQVLSRLDAEENY